MKTTIAEMKELAWTPEVIAKTKVVMDPQLSPDNGSLLFVATEPKATGKKGLYFSRIYKRDLKDTQERLFLDCEASCMQPRWSPDGQWVAFISIQKKVRNLHLVTSAGAVEVVLLAGEKDVQTFSWSPDGTKIAFVMAEETAKAKTKTSLAYEYGEDECINKLFVIDVFSKKLKSLTSEAYCVKGLGDFGSIVAEFDWSPDSKKIVFTYSSRMGLSSFASESSLATVDVDTSEVIPWEKGGSFEAFPKYSPEGTQVAYLSSPSISERCLALTRVALRASDGTNQCLLSDTFNGGAFIVGPSLLGWSKEGKHVLFCEPKGTKYHLLQLPIDGGAPIEMETGETFFKDVSLSNDKKMLAMVTQSPSGPPEACITKINDFKPVQASNVNNALLSYPSAHTEKITWSSTDGLQIEGLLTYPVNYDKKRKYPLLLVIHGGPMGFFDETFLGTPSVYPLAAFAQEGFFILRPNPRGSSGYGKAFRTDNIHDLGGRDFVDLISGIDILIQQGVVDEKRLGVMGWSYGGFLTAWAITQTSRFKAASMGAGYANQLSMAGTMDLDFFISTYLGSYTDARKLYEERSPINYISNVTTPCLIQHGSHDKRVPISQAYEFHHALKQAGKEVTFIIYPGMEHRITDSNMQLEAMERNLAWFKKYV